MYPSKELIDLRLEKLHKMDEAMKKEWVNNGDTTALLKIRAYKKINIEITVLLLLKELHRLEEENEK